MSKIESLDFVEVEGAENTKPLLEPNLEIIKDVKVRLLARVGEAELSVDELMNLGENSVVTLNTMTTTPVELLLDGAVVARGKLVSSDDNFGVQITELGQ